MRSKVVLAGPDLGRLVDLSLELGLNTLDVTLLHRANAVEFLAVRPEHEAALAITVMNATDNVGDLRKMFVAHPHTRFVLLSKKYPPDGAVAKVVAEFGGTVLSADEPAIVVAATAFMMLAAESHAEVS